MRRVSCRTVTIVALMLAAGPAVLQAQVHQSIRLDLPVQPLADSLRAVGLASNTNIVFDPRLVAGITAPAFSGMVTAEEALEQLLAGTRVRFKFVDEKTVSLMPARATGKSTVSANDPLEGAMRLAQADAAAPSEEPQQGEEPGEDAGGAKLEEIIVTATKRAESVRDVPLSITAIGKEEISRRGLQGMGDYLSAVPGVSFIETDGSNNAIVIRGIDTGPEAQNIRAGTTVATYFGETPITNSAGLMGGSGVDIKLVDIDRIEVLRGPQGTAFGNSSLGGAVRTIPTAPRLDAMEGKLAVEYSHTGRDGSGNDGLEGVLNLPLVTDRLAIRAVGYQFESSGYYRNISGSDPEMQAYAASLGPRAVSLATSSDDRGRLRTRGARFAALWQATDAMRLTLSYLYQKSEQTGDSASSGLGDGYGYRSFRILPSRGTRGSEDNVQDTRIELTNGMLEYDLGWADLVASASWVDSGSLWVLGAGYESPYDFQSRSPHEQFSSELRLASKLQGRWAFLAGLYHENMRDFSSEHYSSLETADLMLERAGYGDGVNELLGVFDNTRKVRQDAAFGEVSYRLLENLTLTGGARLYEFERHNRLDTSGWFAGTPLDAPDVSRTAIKRSGESFKANLGYKPSQRSLLYAGWAQGFRLGQPTAGLIPAICDTDGDGFVDGTGISIASTRMIDSDHLDNFEIGGKTTLLGGRLTLDTSVYRIKWTGLPTNARAQCGDSGYSYVANAGKASSQGIEFQSNYSVTRGFRVSFGGSYTDAELRKDNDELGGFAGDRLPGSPRWIANLGMQYDFNVSGHEAFVRADSAYRGVFYSDFRQNPEARSGGYVLVDARAGVAIRGISIEAFVENLTDVDDYAWRGLDNTDAGFGYIMRPRTVGLRLGYDF